MLCGVNFLARFPAMPTTTLAPGTLITADCLLFDMDGTLVDSTAAVERVWGGWAARHGISFADFRHDMHGRRAIDIMRALVPPQLDATVELRSIVAGEMVETDGIVPIPGAARLLASLPRERWALVTSAQLPLARVRLRAAGLPLPDTVVAAEDIGAGKPDPGCYRLALARLGCRAENAVVFEDAPAGIAAGVAAGCRTVAIRGNSLAAPDQSAQTVPSLPDFSCLVLEKIDANDGRLHLRVLPSAD